MKSDNWHVVFRAMITSPSTRGWRNEHIEFIKGLKGHHAYSNNAIYFEKLSDAAKFYLRFSS